MQGILTVNVRHVQKYTQQLLLGNTRILFLDVPFAVFPQVSGPPDACGKFVVFFANATFQCCSGR
jgi:hypothetical protein